MVTTSLNFSSDFKLVNFKVPNYLIQNFDNLVRFKRVSRTSMLIHLMENYIRNEKQNMETDDSLNELIVNISKRNRTSIKKELKKMKDEFIDNEPPMIPYSSDESFNWEDRLERL